MAPLLHVLPQLLGSSLGTGLFLLFSLPLAHALAALMQYHQVENLSTLGQPHFCGYHTYQTQTSAGRGCSYMLRCKFQAELQIQQ